jgi:surfeit locus 1 family protein
MDTGCRRAGMKRLKASAVYWAGRWRPGWKMSVFVAVMLPTVISLGLWQLERADEKRWYESRQLQRMGDLPRPPPRELDADSAFLRVAIAGRYDPDRYYLVDNRVHGGRPGYWAVSRFQADDGRVWLVNRGWIAGAPGRDALPEVATPWDPVRVVGVVWPDTGLPPLLAPDPWPPQWPKRVQRLDVARMAADGAAVVPVEVRLEPGEPGSLQPAPLDVVFSPAVHHGYALQWFGLGAALAIGYLVFGFRRVE